jgi:hypothetical protein
MCDTVKRSYHMHMMVIGLEHQARDKEESTHQVDNVMFVEVDERLGHTHQNVATPAKASSLLRHFLMGALNVRPNITVQRCANADSSGPGDSLVVVVDFLVGIVRHQQRAHQACVHKLRHQADPANLMRSTTSHQLAELHTPALSMHP